ncbi:MAG: RNA 2',3'-cyclic phosphodiesterase [Opitutae bacterium]|nr:RNA 2',3'-cyclic phosphodiesterase [Opitutae bacterium]
MPSLRLFIAISLPDAHRDTLAELRSAARGWSWTPQGQLHLTMRFLGDIAEERLKELTAALARVRVEPFVLPLEGVGVFPPRGAAQVLWVGVGRGHPRLFQLRQQIDDALLALGLPVELRTFHPHVTLARVRREAAPTAAAQFLKTYRDFASAPFRAEAFDMYRSELTSDGAVHTRLQRFPLGKDFPDRPTAGRATESPA